MVTILRDNIAITNLVVMQVKLDYDVGRSQHVMKNFVQ